MDRVSVAGSRQRRWIDPGIAQGNLPPKVDVAGKIRILPASGGKFKLLFSSVLMVRIVQYAILPLNFL